MLDITVCRYIYQLSGPAIYLAKGLFCTLEGWWGEILGVVQTALNCKREVLRRCTKAWLSPTKVVENGCRIGNESIVHLERKESE